MHGFIYVMAIMGCGDGGLGCQEVRMVDTRYASLAACQQAASAQLIANSDLDYPEMLATCRSVTSRIVSAEPAVRAR
jgi:hypothetical protein